MADSGFDPTDNSFAFEALIEDAVKQILRYEDPQVFIRWMRENIYHYFNDSEGPQASLFDLSLDSDNSQEKMDPEMARSLAVNIAYAIWNGMPLPSNNFKPRPMTMPNRNDPCYCGSAKKYKQCCAHIGHMPPLDPNQLWLVMFENLDKDVAARAIRDNQVPLGVLNMIAFDYIEEDRPRKALALLEPLFEGNIRKTNDHAEYALTLLCNCYDDLGFGNKKTTLLKTITQNLPRSPLRSGAWQRLATIRIDNGDADGSWVAFKNAQRDDPNSLGLSVLEVQILNAQGNNDKARQRADFWIHRLRREGVNDDEMPLNFLLEVAKNPDQAFAEIGMNIVDEAGPLLMQWLDSVRNRPLPGYQIVGEIPPVDFENSSAKDLLRADLFSQGMDEDQVHQALQDLEAEADDIDYDIEGDDYIPEYIGGILQTPPKLKQLEKNWHNIFVLNKPFSVHDTPFGEDDLWDEFEGMEWVVWLQDNPAAFDSLDILDDLATALMMHPQIGMRWLDEILLGPVLKRAEAILELAIKKSGDTQLHWIMPENRPVLRSLARLVQIAMITDEFDEIMYQSRRLLRLNPHDNHGFRTIVMNDLIIQNLDEEALELAENYPNDMNPEIAYGRVLALYRLGRQREAVQALGDAMEFLGKIPRYLVAKRVKKPKLHAQGVTVGGDDQAWYYREEMREIWQITPGALEWLKKAEKAFLLGTSD